jgi:large subunit ribosomal protein L32e
MKLNEEEKQEMRDIKKLLEKRRALKKKKPVFRRKDIYKKKKLAKMWRRARGLDNKQRLHKRGAPPVISTGYRAPKAVRGLHHSGLRPIVVSNLAQLNALTKDDGIILSANLGNRKRQMLINEIKKKGLVIINLDADETLEKIQTALKQRKSLRTKRLEEQKDKKKSTDEKMKKEKEEAKKDELKKEEPSVSEEEKKKLEKEEKDKLLTKRE